MLVTRDDVLSVTITFTRRKQSQESLLKIFVAEIAPGTDLDIDLNNCELIIRDEHIILCVPDSYV